MKHFFPVATRDLEQSTLTQGVVDLPTWMRRVRELAAAAAEADLFPDRDEFVGDAFEHLVECIVAWFRDNPDVNCAEIALAEHKEIGVDFVGRTHSDDIHTLQCKFRSNTNHLLNNTDDNISNFLLASVSKHAASYMTIWTTAKGVHWDFVEMGRRLQGVSDVRVFGYVQIRELVDGDKDFWRFYANDLIGRGVEGEGGGAGTLDTRIELREYQKRGYEAFKTAYEDIFGSEEPRSRNSARHLKGRFIYPTGAGKTLIQCLILQDQIRRTENGIHLVLAPRIVLVHQLVNEYRRMIGRDYLAVAFHSGKREPDSQAVPWRELDTTDPLVVDEEQARAARMKKDLVIFSTYHSLHKLVGEGRAFDTVIADESQYCISENYFADVNRLKSKVKIFFTATEKHGVGERSNDNEDVFGPILDQEAVSNLIRDKYLVKPVIHAVYGNKRDAFLDSFVDEANHVAEYQRQNVHKSMKAKTLFACRGTGDVKVIVENMDVVRSEMPDHDIFTILSDSKYGAMLNGVKTRRAPFMRRLRESNNDSMIFHYDILSEGIDIDGITGAAIMRRMGHSKLLQTIGRCLRVYKSDPDIKDRVLISVPVIDGDDKNKEHVKEIIRLMIESGFEINFEDILVSNASEENTLSDEDTHTDDQLEWDFEGRVQTIIQNVVHDIEDEIERDRQKWQAEFLEPLPTTALLKKLNGHSSLLNSSLNDAKSVTHEKSADKGTDVEHGEISSLIRIFTERSDGHKIPTPNGIAKELIDQVNNVTNGEFVNSKIAVLFNMEFVHALVRYWKVKSTNVTYFGDCPVKKEAMQMFGCECRDVSELKEWRRDMKFDVVLGNPPYQKERKNEKIRGQSGNEVWPYFVKKSLDLLRGGAATIQGL